ncbi:hypothetical protein E4U41_002877 [Claviceps citrina]|nr:hypothetical protein E4U41_002877 [Claviceps citrina]
MAWSKSTRIKVMIAIDTAFFLLELVCGFLAHSLALTADAFHMLNDIISLVIGLWAVVASQKETTDQFTFGWVRAEILGAFFNAVFLIALCVSIILEALTRFVEPPEITQPKLILIVGCAGLASNLVGFVVLGGHGHGHGDEEDGHGHGHGHDHHAHANARAHARAHDDDHGDLRSNVADEDGAVGDHQPKVIARRSNDNSELSRHIRFGGGSPGRDDASNRNRIPGQSRGCDGRRRSKSGHSGHSRFHSIDDISIHPASFRQDIIAASLAAYSGAGFVAGSDEHGSVSDPEPDANEESPLLTSGAKGHGNNGTIGSPPHQHGAHKRPRRDSSVHDGHNHTLPRKAGTKASGHSHADMGMNAMILHVLGDALGNVGVIITALIIWLTDWPGKLYFDPAVSLLITAIILKTSIPLTRATARVLLQATPENISIQEIRQDIEGLPGVVSCHHIHVWQLSDTKVVASMHLQVAFPINEHSGEKYMQLAKRARRCLHGYGIHSATIQPEFCLDAQRRLAGDATALRMDGAPDAAGGDAACLLGCIDECQEQGCCSSTETASQASSTRRGSDLTQGDAQHHH